MASNRSPLRVELLPTVYVIDDDEDVRLALHGLLRSVGLPVETFASVEAFVAAGRLDAPGCLVLDVRLTGQSGLSFQKELAAARAGSPIIFISGHADVPMAVQAMKSGAVEFLTKPIRQQDLIDAIQAALRSDAERRGQWRAHERVRHARASLTPREREVMALVVAGFASRQAAERLGISEPTVKAHRVQILRKMGVATLAELVRVVTELEMMEQEQVRHGG